MIKRTLLMALIFLSGFGSFVFSAPPSGPQHGISLYGDLKYGSDFKHFDYVNPNAPKGGTLVRGAVGTFDSLNPFIIKGISAAGVTMLYSSLLHVTLMEVSHDESFSKYGYAAESLERSPDNTWIIFNLREGITFHDGSPLTAEDVVYTFNTLVKKGQPLYKTYYGDVVKVEALNPRQVKFTFKDGENKEIPLIVGDFPILSKAYYTKHGFEKTDITPPLGSGPYRISKVEGGRSITYERVENWWGRDLPVNVGRYNFDTIRFTYYRDSGVAFEGFKSENYDLHLESSSKNWTTGYDFPAMKRGEVIRDKIKKATPAAMQSFIYNTRRAVFKDIQVREALGYAFDFEWANENLFYNLYERTKSYFDNSDLGSSGLPSPEELKILAPYRGKIPEAVFTKEFVLPKTDGTGNNRKNLIKAKGILKRAGYGLKNGVMTHQKTGTPLRFEILIVSPNFQKVIQPFVKNLKRLGVEASIRLVDTAQYTRRVQDYDFDMIMGLFPQSISPGNEQREFWNSKRADIPGTRNYPGIKDPVVDELVELVIDASTREELTQRTKALDRVLLWNHYVIPLYHLGHYLVAYYKKLEHPEKHPPYQPDFDTWWMGAKHIKK